MDNKVEFKASLFIADEEKYKVKRFMVDRSESYKIYCINEELVSVFPELSEFCVCWMDNNGQYVTIYTDEDLSLAMSQMDGPIFKLTVFPDDIKKDEVFHFGIVCNVCDRDVVGTRYKCTVCDDYDLCENCKGSGIHPEHSMISIRFYEATCDSCDQDIIGIRHKCIVCNDFDLCEECKTSEVHSEHSMISIITLDDTKDEEVHYGIFCNVCDQDVTGTRYKCTVCDDYDLCEDCKSSGTHSEHSMISITYNEATCDNCNQEITGVRYKCIVCDDFDLCEECKTLEVHSEHSMISITILDVTKDKEGIHYGILCDVCDQDVIGIRYKCTVCEDYDLCEDCNCDGIHSQHRMITIKTVNAVCDSCDEDINSVRYKCIVCNDYDLCEIARLQGYIQSMAWSISPSQSCDLDTITLFFIYRVDITKDHYRIMISLFNFKIIIVFKDKQWTLK